MQLVLAVTSVVPRNGDITIDKSVIHQTLSSYNKQGSDLNNEEHARQKLVNEIMNAKDDADGSSLGSLQIASGWSDDYEEIQIMVTPSVREKNVLKSLVKKFHEKVKISLYLKWYIPESGCINSYGRAQGMKIDPIALTCVGIYSELSMPASIVSPIIMQEGCLDLAMLIQVELVADIDLAIPNGTCPAQKILERGESSDVIISAGNGAEIKAHKLFLSFSSPVLKAMLGSGMEESQTGRVDMGDLSEEGVRAFLRYVYYEDLEEAKENIQVAYELFYAGHKYDVPSLEAEMRRLLGDAKNEDIDEELAYKIYIFTRNIEAALELKAKTIQILKTNKLDQLYANQDSGESTLGAEIESFLAATDDGDFDVAIAFKMYILARNIESAVDLKNKAFKVVKAKWRDLEALKEYNDLFEKPSNAKTAKELCRDIWLANAAST